MSSGVAPWAPICCLIDKLLAIRTTIRICGSPTGYSPGCQIRSADEDIPLAISTGIGDSHNTVTEFRVSNWRGNNVPR